jgi:hypothetical protein
MHNFHKKRNQMKLNLFSNIYLCNELLVNNIILYTNQGISCRVLLGQAWPSPSNTCLKSTHKNIVINLCVIPRLLVRCNVLIWIFQSQYKIDRVYNDVAERGVQSMRLRFFTPQEIANLMCFPKHFGENLSAL